MIDRTRDDATQLRETFVRGEASAEEIVRETVGRIERTEETLHAFLTLTVEDALAQAGSLDESRARREGPGPLAGVPVAVKDVMAVRGSRTTCGSRMLETFVPSYDATCVARLRDAGAIVIGKTNMDEFAMGSSTEHSAYGCTRNPWDPDRVPGGSSGGSAAAVAANQVTLAIGTDTGGSIRQPAAFTGAVGLKPTYGRVSRFGLIAFASSLDQAGPIARSVRDAALALEVMAGPDARDMTCSTAPVAGFVEAAVRPDERIAGLRVGLPRGLGEVGLDPEIGDAVERCRQLLEKRGARVTEVDLPDGASAIATYYIIATAEASSNLARYDGVRYGLRARGASGLSEMYDATREAGFGPEVKRRIMLGTYVLSAGYYDAYYLRAMRSRDRIHGTFAKIFSDVDVLIGPTTPTPAFRLGENLEDPLSMYLSDVYTVTANLAGLPALSLPCGLTRAGLPVGCQILGRRFDEVTVLATAAALESDLGAGESSASPRISA